MKIMELLKETGYPGMSWVQGNHTRICLTEDVNYEWGFWTVAYNEKYESYIDTKYRGVSEDDAVNAFLESERN